jgi:hypothetical protein
MADVVDKGEVRGGRDILGGRNDVAVVRVDAQDELVGARGLLALGLLLGLLVGVRLLLIMCCWRRRRKTAWAEWEGARAGLSTGGKGRRRRRHQRRRWARKGEPPNAASPMR